MVRLTASDRGALDDFAGDSGIKAAELARVPVLAMLKDYRERKGVLFPMRGRIRVSFDLERLPMAAEPTTTYGEEVDLKALQKLPTSALEAELIRRRQAQHASTLGALLPPDHPAAKSASPATDAVQSLDAEELQKLSKAKSKGHPAGKR